ncbi:hypothetical protein B0A49_02011 [Cryomyces minteri]|uniref:Phosphoribosylaminoimidazole-succinocarboxamide synthase n=1 Tax=Cryomyces minteri TaxID=331657 RepID=A0A4U0XTR0_9PEZI|nr:hypothetical protein B0A49_05964 [Cryomyces minteri]TKA81162.1 hypothetical protein B0A49_02011 [Cryomyces minteri]
MSDLELLAEPYSLKQTNVSKPQLLHANSQQSITASEDYDSFYSASDSVSGEEQDHEDEVKVESDAPTPAVAVRYATPPSRVRTPPSQIRTPPSRIRTPQRSYERLSPSTPESPTPMRGTGAKRHCRLFHPDAQTAALAAVAEPYVSVAVGVPAPVRYSDAALLRYSDASTIKRKPIPPFSRYSSGVMPVQSRYSVAALQDSDEAVPVEHRYSVAALEDREVVVPVHAVYEVAGPPVPPKSHVERVERTMGSVDSNHSITPYIRFALDQLTRDEEVRGTRIYTGLNKDDFNDQRAGLHESLESLNKIETQEMPPRHPLRNTKPPEPLAVQPEVLISFTPSSDDLQHPPLNFLPSILRPLWLGIFVLLVLLMLAALMFCAIYSLQHNGLWNYISFGDGRYFVLQYLPILLGVILLLWLLQVEIAVYRIAPFMALASDSPRGRSNGMLLNLYPSNFVLPNFQHFQAGQPVFGACLFVFWLQIFTIPLLASAFNVLHVGSPGNGNWRWISMQGVIWTVVGLYVLLAIALLTLLLSLRGKTTGVRWDPRSLADVVVLLESSNVLDAYTNSEVQCSSSDLREKTIRRADRLGYWQTSKKPSDIIHTLGEEGAPVRRDTPSPRHSREKSGGSGYSAANTDLESSFGYGEQRDSSMPVLPRDVNEFYDIRHRFIPWFLKDAFAILWIVIATVLLLAVLIVSFINSAVGRGFSPAVSPITNSTGFSPTNFLYSFLPAIIATLLLLFWLTIDGTFRRLQPYASLSSPLGAVAEHSLLLDYSSRLPVSVTVAAAGNGHFKVAYLSFITLIAAAIPILAGGCFWAQFYVSSQTVRIAAHLPAYYALCAFLTIVALSFAAALPGRKRRLPHDTNTLAATVSFLYQSRLLVDPAFDAPTTKTALVTRLLTVPMAEASRPSVSYPQAQQHPDDPAHNPSQSSWSLTDSRTSRDNREAAHRNEALPRYAFGIYLGRDGREHLGIDRRSRRDLPSMVVLGDGDERVHSGRFSWRRSGRSWIGK